MTCISSNVICRPVRDVGMDFFFRFSREIKLKKKKTENLRFINFCLGKCYHFVVGWSFYFLKKKLIGWYYKTKDFDFDSTFPVQIKHGDDWLENSNIKKNIWDIVLCYWVVNKGIYRKSVKTIYITQQRHKS